MILHKQNFINTRAFFVTPLSNIHKFSYKKVKDEIRIGDELCILKLKSRNWILTHKNKRIGEIYKFEIDRLVRKIEKYNIELICVVKEKAIRGNDYLKVAFYNRELYQPDFLLPQKKTTFKKAAKFISKDANVDSENHKKNNLTEEEQRILQYHSTLKLQIELVPRSCFWLNVRSKTTKSQWDKIRLISYQKTNNLCAICGGRGTKHPVECHEVWIYDDTTMTQRLGFFQAICPLCHEVKHIGLARMRGNEERAFNRFKEINQLDEVMARQIKSAVFKQWNIRSMQEWKLDIEHLKEWNIEPKELKK
ncbi:MAG: hypothetical protein WAQ28_03655 [Bacteroidia bacterium]